MTTSGWVFMIGAWTATFSLIKFCFSKALRNRKRQVVYLQLAVLYAPLLRGE